MFHKYVKIDLSFQDFKRDDDSTYIVEVIHPTKTQKEVFQDFTKACELYRNSDESFSDYEVIQYVQKIDIQYQLDIIDPIFTVMV